MNKDCFVVIRQSKLTVRHFSKILHTTCWRFCRQQFDLCKKRKAEGSLLLFYLNTDIVGAFLKDFNPKKQSKSSKTNTKIEHICYPGLPMLYTESNAKSTSFSKN